MVGNRTTIRTCKYRYTANFLFLSFFFLVFFFFSISRLIVEICEETRSDTRCTCIFDCETVSAGSTPRRSLALVGVPRVHRANLLGIAEGIRTKGKINATRPPNTQRETESARKPSRRVRWYREVVFLKVGDEYSQDWVPSLEYVRYSKTRVSVRYIRIKQNYTGILWDFRYISWRTFRSIFYER